TARAARSKEHLVARSLQPRGERLHAEDGQTIRDTAKNRSLSRLGLVCRRRSPPQWFRMLPWYETLPQLYNQQSCRSLRQPAFGAGVRQSGPETTASAALARTDAHQK